MKVIAFYTVDTPYEEEAKKLEKDLIKYDLNYHMYPVISLGNWFLNCGRKSSILQRALKQFSEDLLYLDVDARITRQPPFEEIKRELPGFCFWNHPKSGKELASGTIYLSNGYISRLIVDKWVKAQELNPLIADQKILQSVLDNKEYHYNILPLDWINIKDFVTTEDPIIFHTQASRQLRRYI